MIKSIRMRLVFLYTLTTGLILTTVLILAILLSKQQIIKNKTENFQSLFYSLSKNIQMENVISHLWLSEMELKNRLIIHIEENGIPLKYSGAREYQTDRNTLIHKLKKHAQKDHIDTKISPSSTNEIQSKVYEIAGTKKEKYYGAIFMVPTDNGYRTLILIQYIGSFGILSFPYNIILILLDIIGVLGFYMISKLVVGKSLKQVEEGRRRQNEFIAAASHELKSPLAVIQANASALVIEPDQALHFSKGIENECSRLKSLIEDMLLLTMADTKNWDMKKELIDMDTLIIELYELYQPLCRQQKKELKLELQEDTLPNIRGDRLRIKQILAAILDNAISYSKDFDNIFIKSYDKKNNIWIEIIDHGCGIEDEKKKEIFERFYRVDKARNKKSHFGLGLSIAKELVELHSGNIFIKDTEGGGATFVVSLPINKYNPS